MTTPSTAQPSLLWRILRFPLVRIILAILFLIVPVGMAQAMILSTSSSLLALVAALLASVLACLAYTAYVRLIERRPVTELGLKGALTELVAGMLVAAVLFSLVMAALWLLGYYRVEGINSWRDMVPPLTLAIVSGVTEELLFRGILFRIVEESLGTWISLLISALFFGLIHMGNPNATLFSAIAIALEAGIMLAAVYMMTRRLWMAIGIHFAWNFLQGGIYNVAVSGIDTSGLLKSTMAGPSLLTGGEFGAEASIMAVAVCLVAGLYFLWRAMQRGHVVQPFWVRQRQAERVGATPIP